MRVLPILLLIAGLTGPDLGAQASPEPLRSSTEVDVLPVATGGWYGSLGAGRGRWRARLVAAEVHVPDRFAPKGWEDGRTRAVALLVDRAFRAEGSGFWVGGGLECWEERLRPAGGSDHAQLRSLQATLGCGWVIPLGRGFHLNPWLAVHQRVGGDREAVVAGQACRPRSLQAEASLKVGWTLPRAKGGRDGRP